MSASPVELTGAARFAEHARETAALRSPEEALRRVVDLAMEVVDCDHASLTLVDVDGTLESPAASDATAAQADHVQYELEEGPCLTAAAEGGVYVIPETASEHRWPSWGARVARMGLHSVLSIQLFTGRDVLGALNLYSRQAQQFTVDDVEAAQVVAAHGSVVLARARTERNLWAAIDARHLIGLAQGMLMERYVIDQDRAFAVLKRHSQRQNRKLRDIASELLSTGALPESPELDGCAKA